MDELKKIKYEKPEIVDFKWMEAMGAACTSGSAATLNCVAGSGAIIMCTNGDAAGNGCGNGDGV